MSDLQERLADHEKRFKEERERLERERVQLVPRPLQRRLESIAYIILVVLLFALLSGLVVAVWRLALGGVW